MWLRRTSFDTQLSKPVLSCIVNAMADQAAKLQALLKELLAAAVANPIAAALAVLVAAAVSPPSQRAQAALAWRARSQWGRLT